MTGIYGDGLLSSPELFRRAVLFDQKPLVNGGYIDQTQGVPVRLIFRDEGSKIQSSGGAIVRTKSKTIWSRKVLVPGAFVLFQNTVYRLMTDQEWDFQAGFYIYGIEKVVGDNGKASYDPKANDGGRTFG